MVLNTLILSEEVVKLQFLALAIGLIDLILTAHSTWDNTSEEFFLVMVALFFFISFLHIIGQLVGCISPQNTSKKIEVIYHGMACFGLILGGILFLISVIKNHTGEHTDRIGLFIEKIIASALGIVNGILYGYLTKKFYKIYKSRRVNELR